MGARLKLYLVKYLVYRPLARFLGKRTSGKGCPVAAAHRDDLDAVRTVGRRGEIIHEPSIASLAQSGIARHDGIAGVKAWGILRNRLVAVTDVTRPWSTSSVVHPGSQLIIAARRFIQLIRQQRCNHHVYNSNSDES